MQSKDPWRADLTISHWMSWEKLGDPLVSFFFFSFFCVFSLTACVFSSGFSVAFSACFACLDLLLPSSVPPGASPSPSSGVFLLSWILFSFIKSLYRISAAKSETHLGSRGVHNIIFYISHWQLFAGKRRLPNGSFGICHIFFDPWMLQIQYLTHTRVQTTLLPLCASKWLVQILLFRWQVVIAFSQLLKACLQLSQHNFHVGDKP